MAGFALAKVTTRKVSGFPAASFTVAESDTLLPTSTAALSGVTVTDATGATDDRTRTVALPLTPSIAAVMVAWPSATAVTSPVTETAATAGPCRSSTEVGVSVGAATGSLKTTLMTVFSGTSIFFFGGSVRTTTGGIVAVTVVSTLTTVTPELSVMTTSIVSPTTAGTGSGSNPPSMTGALMEFGEARLRMTARTPWGAVRGAADTYTTLSPAATDVDIVPPTTRAGTSGCTGSDTMTVRGSGGPPFWLTGFSEQAARHAIAARATRLARRRLIGRSG